MLRVYAVVVTSVGQAPTKGECCLFLTGSGNRSCKVFHEWLNALWENNKILKKNPITLALKQQQLLHCKCKQGNKLSRAAALQSCQKIIMRELPCEYGLQGINSFPFILFWSWSVMLPKPELDKALWKQGSYIQWLSLIVFETENLDFRARQFVKGSLGPWKEYGICLTVWVIRPKKYGREAGVTVDKF